MNRFLFNLSAVLLSALLFPVLQSCGGSGKAAAEISTKERYEIGMAALEDENYLKAQQQFEIILLQDPASEYADDAQFYLGEAHYRDSDYKLAAFHFNRVVRDFPSSIHYKQALFQTGDCYFQVSPNYERDQRKQRMQSSSSNSSPRFLPTILSLLLRRNVSSHCALNLLAGSTLLPRIT